MTIRELEAAAKVLRRAVRIAAVLRLGGGGIRVQVPEWRSVSNTPQQRIQALYAELQKTEALVAEAKRKGDAQSMQAAQAKVQQLQGELDDLLAQSKMRRGARTWAALERVARLKLREAAAKRKQAGPNSGYHDCPCPDCFEIAIGEDEDGTPHLCSNCEDSGCDGEGDCQSPFAYGMDEEMSDEEIDSVYRGMQQSRAEKENAELDRLKGAKRASRCRCKHSGKHTAACFATAPDRQKRAVTGEGTEMRLARTDAGEWVVIVFVNGRRDESQCYYTDDKTDAVNTMRDMRLRFDAEAEAASKAKRKRASRCRHAGSRHTAACFATAEHQPHPGPSRSEHQKAYDAKRQAEEEADPERAEKARQWNEKQLQKGEQRRQQRQFERSGRATKRAISRTGTELRLKRGADSGEWVVCVYVNGRRDESQCYYTDDKADAVATMADMQKRLDAGEFGDKSKRDGGKFKPERDPESEPLRSVKARRQKKASWGEVIGYTFDGAFFCEHCVAQSETKAMLNGACRCNDRDDNGLCASNCDGYGPNAVLDGQDTGDGGFTCDGCGEHVGPDDVVEASRKKKAAEGDWAYCDCPECMKRIGPEGGICPTCQEAGCTEDEGKCVEPEEEEDEELGKPSVSLSMAEGDRSTVVLVTYDIKEAEADTDISWDVYDEHAEATMDNDPNFVRDLERQGYSVDDEGWKEPLTWRDRPDREWIEGYEQHLLGIAEDVIDEIKKERITERDGIIDYLHESVDGDHYVIYTAEANRVLNYSSNSNAAVDSMGSDADDMDTSQHAYFAVEQDVFEKLNELLEQYDTDINDDEVCEKVKGNPDEEEPEDDDTDEDAEPAGPPTVEEKE